MSPIDLFAPVSDRVLGPLLVMETKSPFVLVKFQSKTLSGFRLMERATFDEWEKKAGNSLGYYQFLDMNRVEAGVILRSFGDEWGNFVDMRGPERN